MVILLSGRFDADDRTIAERSLVSVTIAFCDLARFAYANSDLILRQTLLIQGWRQQI
jgi:hypothetical protein